MPYELVAVPFKPKVDKPRLPPMNPPRPRVIGPKRPPKPPAPPGYEQRWRK